MSNKTSLQHFEEAVNQRHENLRRKQAKLLQAGISPQVLLRLFIDMGHARGEFSDPTCVTRTEGPVSNASPLRQSPYLTALDIYGFGQIEPELAK